MNLNSYRNFCLFILLSFAYSCNQPPKDTFAWSVALSAPKFYSAAPSVEFFYRGRSIAGASVNIGISPGWGKSSGGYSTGEQYKEVPDSVFVSWVDTERLVYEGGFKLPRDKMLELFRTSVKEDDGLVLNYSRIVTGTAPGGNVTLWMGAGSLNTEIGRFKAVCKGIWQENNPEYDKYYEQIKKSKEAINSESGVFLYLHGIPYQVWEKKQPEYKLWLGSSNEDSSYTTNMISYSKDGSIYGFDHYFSIPWKQKFNKYPHFYNLLQGKGIKLPVQLDIQHYSRDETRWFNSSVICPQNLPELYYQGYVHMGKKEYYDRIIVLINKDLGKNFVEGDIFLVGKNHQKNIMNFQLSRYDFENKIPTGPLYCIPKDFKFPVWQGREPLPKPQVEFWQEK